MRTNVNSYIREQLNQGIVNGFEVNGVTYHNSYATLLDNHTIQFQDKDGNVIETKTAKYIMLAAGGRPNDGGFPGSELCISSDDLFWMEDPPGKTLVVGAAYIALECGGFLQGLGYDVTVMVRSILLRGFDRECVGKIGTYMEAHGTNFIKGTVPTRFEPGKERKVGCYYELDGEEKYEEYDTVLLAIGRKGEATKLGLDKAGIWFSPRNGKVEAPCERTNVPNIFCIGDLVQNRLELTPVAKAAGKMVVKRLFQDAPANKASMDYEKIATTVFTPLEYGMIGLSEEQCKEKFGADGYQSLTKDASPLEWALTPARQNDVNKGFFKALIQSSNDRIVGFHYLGPYAGEILQGMAVAVKAGATREHLTDTVGIHPTTAETMTMLGGKVAPGVGCAT
jgi:thioredoxin reductase (NADPH)